MRFKSEKEIEEHLARRRGETTPDTDEVEGEDILASADAEYEEQEERYEEDNLTAPDSDMSIETPSEELGEDPSEDMVQMVRELQHELRSMANRVVPSQRKAEEYRRQLEEERLRREQLERERQEEITRLRNQLEEQRRNVPIEEVLDEEELMMFDPTQLKAITKIASEIAKRNAPSVDVQGEVARALKEHEQKTVEQYRLRVINDPSKGLNKLFELQSDPKFAEWTEAEGNEDFNLLMTSLLTTTDIPTIDRLSRRVANRLRDYEGTTATEPRKQQRPRRQADPKSTRVARAMERNPRRLGQDQVHAKLNEAKRLARSRNPQDREKAQRILNELDNS